MNQLLYRPFERIAGFKALLLGLVVIVVTSYVGSYSNTHFPDLLSIKIFPEVKFNIVLIENMVNWITTSVIFYIVGIVQTKIKIRFIDVIGTMALSRFPYFFAVFINFSQSMSQFGYYIQYRVIGVGEEIVLNGFEIFIAIFLTLLTLLSTIWMVALMVNAFKVSTNLKGAKLSWGFIVAILLSIVGTLFINQFILTQILNI